MVTSAVPSSSAGMLVGGRRGELERRGEFVFAKGVGDPGAEEAGRPEGDPGSLRIQPWPRTQGHAAQSQRLTGSHTGQVAAKVLSSLCPKQAQLTVTRSLGGGACFAGLYGLSSLESGLAAWVMEVASRASCRAGTAAAASTTLGWVH